MTNEQHIATVVVLAVALVQAEREQDRRSVQNITTCLLATARALPREEIERLVALVGAPVIELLTVQAPTAAKEGTPNA